jgi:hypothetical protein
VASYQTIRIAQLLRAALCLLLALSLNAQHVAAFHPAAGIRDAVRIFAAASSSPALLSHQGSQRFDSSKQRHPVDVPFILAASAAVAPGRGGLADASGKSSRPRTAFVGFRRGRSPPRRVL